MTRSTMEITFWGTRGSIASPGPDTLIYGGNTTCVEINLCSGRTVIVDSGTGIRCLGDSLLERGKALDLVLLITHIHWDHVSGFPFFGPLFRENTRIVVDGFSRGIDGLKHVFSNKYVDGTWPLRFEDLKACIEPRNNLASGAMTLDSATVTSHRLQHPQGGLGFRFTDASGRLVFLTDNELRNDGWSGTCFKDFVKFCRDADLLVHDCQYLPEELNVRKGWGHSDPESVARLAHEAAAKRLVLFHHDPWRKDAEVSRMVERCAELLARSGTPIEVTGAREGSTLKV